MATVHHQRPSESFDIQGNNEKQEPVSYPYMTKFLDTAYGPRSPVDFPLKSGEYSKISVDPNQRGPYGVKVQPGWRRACLTWVLGFFAVASFVFTAIFAFNATRGDHADTRLLFDNPGKTILVLQILTNVSTTLFSELLVASCEMVHSPD